MAGATGSHVTGSDVTGTGSDRKDGGHVFWDGKLLTSPKKGIAGLEEEKRGHVVMRT